MNIIKKHKKGTVIFAILAVIVLTITAFIIHFNIHKFDKQKEVAVDYVSSKYGDRYEVVSVEPEYGSPMPFAYHLYWVTFEFADKEGKESNFRINVAYHNYTYYVRADYFYMDYNKIVYQNYVNEYIKKYIPENQYKLDALAEYVDKKRYSSYEEMISKSGYFNAECKITIYDKADPEKYYWIYDLYQNLKRCGDLYFILEFSYNEEYKKYETSFYHGQESYSLYSESIYEFFNKERP